MLKSYIIKIDLWKVSADLSRLQKVNLAGETWVRIDDVIEVLRREAESDGIDNDSSFNGIHSSGS